MKQQVLLLINFVLSFSAIGQTNTDSNGGFKNFTETVTGVSIDMVAIKGGSFTMGSPENKLIFGSQNTQHQVLLSDFYMSNTEVTIAQFKMFIDATGYQTDADKNACTIWNGRSYIQKTGVNWECDMFGNKRPTSEYNHPVIFVSWNDANAYCIWLSQKTGESYRLPTEAEWEYACRAGTSTMFYTGNNLTSAQANYNGYLPFSNNAIGEYRNETLAVGSFAPNSWGLYDMHGNVWEWCSDWEGDYLLTEQTNPQGPLTGLNRIIRGGCWHSPELICRSDGRNASGQSYCYNDLGFRLVCSPAL